MSEMPFPYSGRRSATRGFDVEEETEQIREFSTRQITNPFVCFITGARPKVFAVSLAMIPNVDGG
jgi:hypothetical protein